MPSSQPVTSMPDLTVLLPIYKPDPKHLWECLQSIEAQSLCKSRFSVLIIADGDPDKSILSIIRIFSSQSELSLSFIQLKHSGLRKTLNYGLSIISTKYVARLDSDDVCEPLRLEAQLQYLYNNPSISAIFSQAKFIDSHSRLISTRSYLRRPLGTLASCLYGAMVSNPYIHPTVTFELDAIRAVGGYPADSPFEDYSLWGLLILHGYQIKVLRECLLRYRVHGSQISSRVPFGYLALLRSRGIYLLSLFRIYPLFSLLWLATIPIVLLPHPRVVSASFLYSKVKKGTLLDK